jgi:hypothetical protein
MCEAYAQRPMCDYFGEGKVRRFDIEVTLDDLQVGRDATQEFIRFPVCDVAEAEDLSDLARRKELLELEML